MDIRLLSEAELTNFRGFPNPCGTATVIIENLRSWCADNNIEGFQKAMYSEVLDVADLHDVMMEAIELDRVDFVSTLFFHGCLVKPFFAQKATLRKSTRVLECLLAAGWDINEPVDILIPPVLCFAVKDAEMTSWFLDHGANPNTRCEVDCTPLSFAVRNAPMSIIELLLDRGGDVGKEQLLQYAVCRDEELEDVISLLVEKGAPLNATMCQDGPTSMRFFPTSLGTALHLATEQRRTNAIRLLIHLGADTEVKDANGDTALELAQKWNKAEIAQLLRDLGARF